MPPPPRRRDDRQPPGACPPAGTPGPDERDTPTPTTTRSTSAASPPAQIMRRTAPASRPSGRDAVELRSSLDPGAHPGAPTHNEAGQRKITPPLDRPHSFRDDLREEAQRRRHTCCGVTPLSRAISANAACSGPRPPALPMPPRGDHGRSAMPISAQRSISGSEDRNAGENWFCTAPAARRAPPGRYGSGPGRRSTPRPWAPAASGSHEPSALTGGVGARNSAAWLTCGFVSAMSSGMIRRWRCDWSI